VIRLIRNPAKTISSFYPNKGSSYEHLKTIKIRSHVEPAAHHPDFLSGLFGCFFRKLFL